MEEKNFGEKILSWARNSITLKLFLLLFLVLILLIPAFAIKSLVEERASRNIEVMREINQKWGDKLKIEGAVVVVPYKSFKGSTVVYEGYFFPDSFTVNSKLNAQTKQRGIFKTNVYTGDFELTAEFDGLKAVNSNPNNVPLWDQAFVLIGINHPESVSSDVSAIWNEKSYKFEPGLESKATIFANAQPREKLFTNGFHLNLPLDKEIDIQNQKYTLKATFKANGSGELNFLPMSLGKTKVDVQANWADPSFIGSYLPVSSEITDNGFTASWSVNNFAKSSIPAQFDQTVKYNSFGLSLLEPLTHYQKVTRSVKYSSLFLILTFILILVLERLTKMKIHPLQYLFVGLAMLLFHLLLLSTSEYLGFSLSYGIASIATIGLISLYSRSLFAKKSYSLILAGSLLVLYGFLFFLLQSKDYTLLVGSISLFILLALFMYLTRNINKQAATDDNQK